MANKPVYPIACPTCGCTVKDWELPVSCDDCGRVLKEKNITSRDCAPFKGKKKYIPEWRR